MAAAAHIMSASPIRRRVRVSSHALYQSISVLRRDGFEEDLFQRDGQNVDRHRAQRARLLEDLLGAGAGEHAEHASLAAHTRDTRAAKRGCRRLAVEHQLNAPKLLAKVVERAGHNGLAPADNG